MQSVRFTGASEFRHYSHQTSVDVCEMDVLKQLQLKNEPFYVKMSSFLQGPLK